MWLEKVAKSDEAWVLSRSRSGKIGERVEILRELIEFKGDSWKD